MKYIVKLVFRLANTETWLKFDNGEWFWVEDKKEAYEFHDYNEALQTGRDAARDEEKDQVVVEEVEDCKYTTEVGDYVIIWITGDIHTYIAEVTQAEPLRLKVMEAGPFANLKDGDYIILEEETKQAQKDCRENTCDFLISMQKKGVKVVSGLKSLGITDGKLRYIYPV